MTGLELIKKIEEHDFMGLVVNGYAAVEIKEQAEELGIELSDALANTIAVHYEKFGYGVNLSKEDNKKFLQGLKEIQL